MFMSITGMLLSPLALLLGGAALIYLGFRRAKNETARLKAPTRWDYLNQGAGYWILGGILTCFSISQLFSWLFG